MPSNKGTASLGSFERSITASATGSSISAVAVFEIHILNVAAAAIKPMTSRRLLEPPKRLTMNSATRRWAPLRSMAVDKMKPPINNNTNGLP